MRERKALLVQEPLALGLCEPLARKGLEPLSARTCAEALDLLAAATPELVVIAIHRPADLALVREARRRRPQLPIIVIAERSSETLVIDALNAGATRYFRPPFGAENIAGEAVALLGDPTPCPTGLGEELRGGKRLVGNGAAMRELRAYVKKVAVCDSSVLITGDTGTGKELVAELIHENSPRRDKPFVSLNANAIPDSLLESELFGHERGAFTGASAPRRGKFALADRGTIFLDEIGDISTQMQVKLLRALDGKEIYRLGGDRSIPLDVRVLAATNHDLESAVKGNRFRADLYFRLNVIRVRIPPLRERLEDIPLLLDHYLAYFNNVFRRQVRAVTPGALDLLRSYVWPGNIRELRNVLEVTFVMLPDRPGEVIDLPDQIKRHLVNVAAAHNGEYEELLRALVANNWNKSRAADQLHWSRMKLYRKMTLYRVIRSQELTKGVS